MGQLADALQKLSLVERGTFLEIMTPCLPISANEEEHKAKAGQIDEADIESVFHQIQTLLSSPKIKLIKDHELEGFCKKWIQLLQHKKEPALKKFVDILLKCTNPTLVYEIVRHANIKNKKIENEIKDTIFNKQKDAVLSADDTFNLIQKMHHDEEKEISLSAYLIANIQDLNNRNSNMSIKKDHSIIDTIIEIYLSAIKNGFPKDRRENTLFHILHDKNIIYELILNLPIEKKEKTIKDLLSIDPSKLDISSAKTYGKLLSEISLEQKDDVEDLLDDLENEIIKDKNKVIEREEALNKMIIESIKQKTAFSAKISETQVAFLSSFLYSSYPDTVLEPMDQTTILNMLKKCREDEKLNAILYENQEIGDLVSKDNEKFNPKILLSFQSDTLSPTKMWKNHKIVDYLNKHFKKLLQDKPDNNEEIGIFAQTVVDHIGAKSAEDFFSEQFKNNKKSALYKNQILDIITLSQAPTLPHELFPIYKDKLNSPHNFQKKKSAARYLLKSYLTEKKNNKQVPIVFLNSNQLKDITDILTPKEIIDIMHKTEISALSKELTAALLNHTELNTFSKKHPLLKGKSIFDMFDKSFLEEKEKECKDTLKKIDETKSTPKMNTQKTIGKMLAQLAFVNYFIETPKPGFDALLNKFKDTSIDEEYKIALLENYLLDSSHEIGNLRLQWEYDTSDLDKEMVSYTLINEYMSAIKNNKNPSNKIIQYLYDKKQLDYYLSCLSAEKAREIFYSSPSAEELTSPLSQKMAIHLEISLLNCDRLRDETKQRITDTITDIVDGKLPETIWKEMVQYPSFIQKALIHGFSNLKSDNLDNFKKAIYNKISSAGNLNDTMARNIIKDYTLNECIDIAKNSYQPTLSLLLLEKYPDNWKKIFNSWKEDNFNQLIEEFIKKIKDTTDENKRHQLYWCLFEMKDIEKINPQFFDKLTEKEINLILNVNLLNNQKSNSPTKERLTKFLDKIGDRINNLDITIISNVINQFDIEKKSLLPKLNIEKLLSLKNKTKADAEIDQAILNRLSNSNPKKEENIQQVMTAMLSNNEILNSILEPCKEYYYANPRPKSPPASLDILLIALQHLNLNTEKNGFSKLLLLTHDQEFSKKDKSTHINKRYSHLMIDLLREVQLNIIPSPTPFKLNADFKAILQPFKDEQEWAHRTEDSRGSIGWRIVKSLGSAIGWPQQWGYASEINKIRKLASHYSTEKKQSNIVSDFLVGDKKSDNLKEETNTNKPIPSKKRKLSEAITFFQPSKKKRYLPAQNLEHNTQPSESSKPKKP